MKPFILSYVQKIPKTNITPHLVYSKEYEVSLFENDYSYNNDKDIILLSGSLMTKADGDPTRDESTDR